jgi:hypothetical protein
MVQQVDHGIIKNVMCDTEYDQSLLIAPASGEELAAMAKSPAMNKTRRPARARREQWRQVSVLQTHRAFASSDGFWTAYSQLVGSYLQQRRVEIRALPPEPRASCICAKATSF